MLLSLLIVVAAFLVNLNTMSHLWLERSELPITSSRTLSLPPPLTESLCMCTHYVSLASWVAQTVYGAGVLIQAAFALTGMANLTYIGGSKDLSTSPLTGWSWSDGTPASNVNCGATGCTCVCVRARHYFWRAQ